MSVVRSLFRSLVMLIALVVVLFFAETVPGGQYEVKGRLVNADGEPIKKASKKAATKESDDDPNANPAPNAGTKPQE